MRIRDDNIKCEFCEKDLNEELYEETHTRLGRDFCNYECMEAFYGDEIPEDEEFISVPR